MNKVNRLITCLLASYLYICIHHFLFLFITILLCITLSLFLSPLISKEETHGEGIPPRLVVSMDKLYRNSLC